MADIDHSIRVDHPDFLYAYTFGADGGPVVIFQREQHHPPTPTPATRFAAWSDAAWVESVSADAYVRLTEVFTVADVSAMVEATKRDLPDHRVLWSWNGVGCRTLSISVDAKKEGPRA